MAAIAVEIDGVADGRGVDVIEKVRDGVESEVAVVDVGQEAEVEGEAILLQAVDLRGVAIALHEAEVREVEAIAEIGGVVRLQSEVGIERLVALVTVAVGGIDDSGRHAPRAEAIDGVERETVIVEGVVAVLPAEAEGERGEAMGVMDSTADVGVLGALLLASPVVVSHVAVGGSEGEEGVEAVGRIVKEVVADVAVHVEVRTDAVVEIAAVAVIGDVGHDAP